MNSSFGEYPTAEREENDAPIGLVALWNLLWRNKRHILLPSFLLAVLAGLFALSSDDTYTAEAQMLLARGNLEIVDFDSTGGTEISQSAITNAMTVLVSRQIALDVIERLDLAQDAEVNPNLSLSGNADQSERYSDAAVRQLAVEWLAGAIRINALPGNSAISIHATTTVPEKSTAIANTYVEAYLDFQRNRGQREIERAAASLETRVSELRQRLQTDQEQLQNYRAEAPRLDAQSAERLAGEAVNIRMRLGSVEAQLTEVEAAVAFLSNLAPEDIPTLERAIETSEVLQRLTLNALGEAATAEQLAEDTQVLTSALKAEQARLTRLLNALQDGEQAINEKLLELNDFNLGLRELEFEAATTAQVYEASLARLKELVMQTGLRDAGAQFLARADIPQVSDARGRRRMVAIASVLGLFLGIAYVLVREAANDRIRKISDLATITGCETIIQLPPTPKAAGNNRDVVPFLEGVRSVRQRLDADLQSSSGGGGVIGIFSSLPTEGKTALVRALAKSYSMADRSVIVVDADMRAGKLSRKFGMPEDNRGLQTVLSDQQDLQKAIVALEDQGFDLLPNGGTNVHSADLLEKQRFAEVLSTLRARYDVVLLDTPPILVLPDAQSIAAHMDAILLVAQYDVTPMPALRDTISALKNIRARPAIVAFCDAPQALGQDYGFPGRAFSAYWEA